MNCKIMFTETARDDLRELTLYLADLTKDKQQALRLVKGLQEQTHILEQFSESGAIPKDRILKSNEYRFLVYRDYLLFYQYRREENTAYVMAIVNGKRDYMRVMK